MEHRSPSHPARLRRLLLAAALLCPGLGASLTPGSAHGAVLLGPNQVAVSMSAGTALIERSPFRLAFLAHAGAVVLSELPAAMHALRLPAPPPPLAPLFGPPLQATLFAPLEFTVGTERDATQSSGTWAGDLSSSARTGIVYSARRVLAAQRDGAGVRLVLSTSDPSHRRLVMTVAPGGGSTFRVGVAPSPSAGVVGIGDSFASGPGEAFHGFGGRHLGLDQRGSSFYNWVSEENVNAAAFGIPGSAAGTLLYPGGSQAAYDPQASFVSSRGYGFLLDSTALARFRLDAGRPAWQVDVSGPQLDYHVSLGSAAHNVTALTALNGRQPIAPAWALGSTLDRETQLGQTPAMYLAQVRQDLVDIRRYRLPLSAYRLEGWARLPTAVLRGLIAQLHRLRIHALVYFRAFAAQDAAGTEAPGTYSYAVVHGLVARRANGQPYVFGDSFGGPAVLIDFTNPAARRWWAARLRRALDLGADGFMQDFGEEVLPGMTFHNGQSGLQMHNRYPILYAQATRQVLAAYMRDHPGRHLFFYTRAGYSGTPGSAAYENGNFAGDETTDWTRASGLRAVIPDLLNRAVGGAYGYSTDIGGYLDLFSPRPTTKELLLRWAELAVFTPFFRLHGSLVAGTHTPWRYDSQTVHVYDALARLHDRAVPLILSLWRQAERTGIPPTRPLWLTYPNDPRADRQDQEWLLGPNLLVAPVVDPGASGRSVYFPAGCWRSPRTGRAVHGPGARWVRAPLAVLPYFVRCATPAP